MKTTDEGPGGKLIHLFPHKKKPTMPSAADLRAAIEELVENTTDGQGCLLADGYDGAFLGLTEEGGHWRAVYSSEDCINILIARDGMTEEDAEEYFQYKIAGANVGPGTPIFILYIYSPTYLSPGEET